MPEAWIWISFWLCEVGKLLNFSSPSSKNDSHFRRSLDWWNEKWCASAWKSLNSLVTSNSNLWTTQSKIYVLAHITNGLASLSVAPIHKTQGWTCFYLDPKACVVILGIRVFSWLGHMFITVCDHVARMLWLQPHQSLRKGVLCSGVGAKGGGQIHISWYLTLLSTLCVHLLLSIGEILPPYLLVVLKDFGNGLGLEIPCGGSSSLLIYRGFRDQESYHIVTQSLVRSYPEQQSLLSSTK